MATAPLHMTLSTLSMARAHVVAIKSATPAGAYGVATGIVTTIAEATKRLREVPRLKVSFANPTAPRQLTTRVAPGGIFPSTRAMEACRMAKEREMLRSRGHNFRRLPVMDLDLKGVVT